MGETNVYKYCMLYTIALDNGQFFPFLFSCFRKLMFLLLLLYIYFINFILMSLFSF